MVAFRLEDAGEVAAADDGATLIGPSAEEAGLTSERVRAAAARRERRRAPVEAPRPRRWKTAAKVLAVLVVIAGIGVAAVLGARQVYFLGIDEGGRVTLYRGLPYDLPLGVELYSEVYSIPVQAASIPEDRRDSLIDHDLRSRDDAISLLDDLEAAAVTPATPGHHPAGNGADGGAAAERPGRRRSQPAGGNNSAAIPRVARRAAAAIERPQPRAARPRPGGGDPHRRASRRCSSSRTTRSPTSA